MTILSRKGVLAVAAVTDIAMHTGKRPMSAKTLAARYGLAPRHLEPVLQALVREGVLRGVRGPGGGYEVARDRSEITAEEIVRIVETAEPVSKMAAVMSPLLLNVVIPTVAQAEQAFSEVLTGISIEDLVRIATTLV